MFSHLALLDHQLQPAEYAVESSKLVEEQALPL